MQNTKPELHRCTPASSKAACIFLERELAFQIWLGEGKGGGREGGGTREGFRLCRKVKRVIFHLENSSRREYNIFSRLSEVYFKNESLGGMASACSVFVCLKIKPFREYVILGRKGNRINSNGLIQRALAGCMKETLLFLGIEVPVREGSSDVIARVTCRQRGILRTRRRLARAARAELGGGGMP